MTMQSSSLLPALQKLPGDGSGQRRSFREIITDVVNMDRAMYVAEFASAASFGLWTAFGSNNVDDNLTAAYEAQYPGEAASQSLHEQWQEMMERGPDSMKGFIYGLKGKVAEFNAKDLLESNGYTDVSLHPDPTNEGWDISAINPDGEPVTISVKTGVSDSQYYDTQEAMRETDFPFALGTELHERVSENAPELAERILVDIGSDYTLVAGTEDGLGTLSSNMGLDIPDGVVELVPYAGAIIAGARLVYSVIKTEKEFKAADRTTRNKIQVVQSLTVMSRLGVTTVLAAAGGAGGTAIGSIIPGPGNIIGGIVGSLTGASMGMYLSRHLQPHMLNLALDITGLTNDDLFYYKNKPRIDTVAWSFQTTARELAAAPA